MFRPFWQQHPPSGRITRPGSHVTLTLRVLLYPPDTEKAGDLLRSRSCLYESTCIPLAMYLTPYRWAAPASLPSPLLSAAAGMQDAEGGRKTRASVIFGAARNATRAAAATRACGLAGGKKKKKGEIPRPRGTWPRLPRDVTPPNLRCWLVEELARGGGLVVGCRLYVPGLYVSTTGASSAVMYIPAFLPGLSCL